MSTSLTSHLVSRYPPYSSKSSLLIPGHAFTSRDGNFPFGLSFIYGFACLLYNPLMLWRWQVLARRQQVSLYHDPNVPTFCLVVLSGDLLVNFSAHLEQLALAPGRRLSNLQSNNINCCYLLWKWWFPRCLQKHDRVKIGKKERCPQSFWHFTVCFVKSALPWN